MSKIVLSIIMFIVAASLLMSCNRGTREEAKYAPSPPVAVPQDSPQARAALAEQIMQSYTREQFGADLAEQLDKIVGSEVLDEARVKFRERMSEKAFDAHRLQSLTEGFDTAELTALNELLKTEAGKSVFRKLPAYWRKWGEKVSPVVYEVLTNAQEAPKGGSPEASK